VLSGVFCRGFCNQRLSAAGIQDRSSHDVLDQFVGVLKNHRTVFVLTLLGTGNTSL